MNHISLSSVIMNQISPILIYSGFSVRFDLKYNLNGKVDNSSLISLNHSKTDLVRLRFQVFQTDPGLIFRDMVACFHVSMFVS